MKCWPQQLNFATWCVTTGSRVSREIFNEDNSTLPIPPQVRVFYIFHVYFTVRHILFQFGGPQTIHALPGDVAFKQGNNPYVVAYRRICNKFGVDVSSAFCYTAGSKVLHN